MQIGVDSFGAVISDPATGLTVSALQRMDNLLDEIVLADQVGLDVFGIGEHHRSEFVDSAPPVILGVAAARTKNIRLTSAVTVLSAADPVRIFQEFATLDLISHGRAEIVAGRGSSIEAFPLFGFDLDDYDSLFSEKLELLLKIRENTHVHWTGRHRAPLTGQAVYPRPLQNPLPIWVGVGGTPESFVRAGTLGLPLMVAVIGGEPKRFRPLVDLYREAGRRSGHSAEKLIVGLHAIGFLGDTTQQAADDFYPGYAHTFTEIGKERGSGTGEGLLLHQKLSVCSLPFLLRHDRGRLHRDMSFWALLVSLFGCCHIISPFVLRNKSRPLDLKSFLTLPMHTVRIPPADATPATITAVLSMHAGHICSSSEIRLSPFCIPPARYRLQANILKL